MTESSDRPEPANAPRRARGGDRERIELCRKLLATRVSEYDVERAAANQFGVSRRMAQRYLAAAKQGMLDAAGRSYAEHRAEAYAWYCSLIGGKDIKVADQLKAQERIEKLLGLDASSRGEGELFDGQQYNIVWLLLNLHHSAAAPKTPPGISTP